MNARKLDAPGVPLPQGMSFVDFVVEREFADRLRSRLRKESDRDWVRQYVSDAVVLTEAAWMRAFPDYPLRRLP